jgi:hypothetical protein
MPTRFIIVGFNVMSVNYKTSGWDVTRYSVVGRYRRFDGTYCFHLHGKSYIGCESLEQSPAFIFRVKRFL